MKRLLLALALASAGVSAGAMSAQAQALTLGSPGYGGSGCPQGTANAVVGNGGQTLSILYDQYIAETTGGRTLDRKSCNLSIPLNVPAGYSVSIVGIDYRGFNFLPAGTSSTFRVEYFFAGGSGPVFQQSFNGSLTDDFLIHNNIGVAASNWSGCGQDVILRTNSSIRVNAPGGQQAMATVDSEDIDSALVFLLSWQTC